MSRRNAKEPKYAPFGHLHASLVVSAIIAVALFAGIIIILRSLPE